MKKFFVVLLVLTGSLFAQSEFQIDHKKCEKAILHSLKCDNDGVVECAVFNLLVYNLSGRKNLVTVSVLKELELLKYGGRSERIRKYPDWLFDFLSSNDKTMRMDVKYGYHDKEKMFKLILKALKVNKTVVAEQ